MKLQNQIKRTLTQPASIDYVRELLEGNQFRHRSELTLALCEKFGFYDMGGQPQLSGCVKALRKLEDAGHFKLPAACKKNGPKSPRRLNEPVAPPVNVPAQVGDIGGLRLELITTTEKRRIWNELMLTEHPQGAGLFVGRQLRYLIGSEHGWLGGLGFAAAALQLAARDKWIGWDAEQRQAHLHAVVGMSRFLIRPNVQCRNLASKILSLAMERMPDDFQIRYNYRPLMVESFVDTSLYSGTCYQAANWISVGETQGRGRQDRFTQSSLSVKTIYLYPLVRDFRERMDLPATAGLSALGPADGLEEQQWAQNEFGGAPLGDVRLARRLVNVATLKAQVPDRAFSGVAKGDWAQVKGYYRMIERPDESAISMPNILLPHRQRTVRRMPNILLPHRQRTVRRMEGQKTVLCIQDGTDLNYSSLTKCTGLGVIGTNQTDAKSLGLHMHSTFAVAPNGLPLGVVKVQCAAPKEKSPEEKRPAFAIPIEEKKTFCWIEHHRDLVELSAKMPHTRLIDVCDREADFFEMFDEQRQNPRVDLLVRANHNRNTIEEPFKLFESVRQETVQSEVRVHIPRQSARPKRSKQKARPKRPGRMAQLAVRYKRVKLMPAHYHADKDPIEIWVVHALEENPPANTNAVEWFLLTTVNITSSKDALRCLRWYCLRWRIEDWHRVLKSGCRIESIAHETAERLRRAIAINLVIAWRIMLMTLMGRETPDLPAELLFSDIELRTLGAYLKKTV
jgi:hypothetical protein